MAHRLLDKGYHVITLTNSMHRSNPFGIKVWAYAFNFDNLHKLTQSLKGVSVLYNTFGSDSTTRYLLSPMRRHTITLFNAAKEARVGKIVHAGITNPSADSHL